LAVEIVKPYSSCLHRCLGHPDSRSPFLC